MENVKFYQTSFFRNRPLEWFGIRVSTLTGTVFSCLPALVVVSALKEHPVIGFFIAAGIVLVSFRMSEHLRQGKYEGEQLEKLLVKFHFPFSKKVLNSEPIARSIVREDEWYLPSGDCLIGFEFHSSEESSFDAFVSTLLPMLPAYSSVKFMRPQRPDRNVPPYLQQKNVTLSEYYVFVKIPLQITGSAIAKNTLKDNVLAIENSSIRKMKCEEIAAVAEYIFFPFQHETGKTKPFFRSDIEITQGLGKGLWPSQDIASISLVQLPEKFVGQDFQNIYDSISHLFGTVCVTLERIEISKIKKAYFNHFNRKHNKIEDNSLFMQTQGDSTPVKMHIGILLHGSEKELAQAFFELDRNCVAMGNDFKPIFGQDIGFLKRALSVYLPGSRPLVPFRMHTVDSLSEIKCYLPKPDSSNFLKDNDLVFRTRQNKVFSIKQSPEFPVLFVGDMGAGKSFLLSLNIFAHLKRREKEQVAGCYLEIGGSFRFLMTPGLADVYFFLRLQDDGNISPLQDHPLRSFRFFGKKGEEAAIKWVMILCEISSYSREIVQNAEHLIAKTISEFFEEKKESLFDFYLSLKENVADLYPEVRTERTHEWRTIMNNLARYVDEKRWGKIYCPTEVSQFDYDKARFFYFTTFESSMKPEGVFKPFFSFSIMLSELVAEKYSSNTGRPSRVQFLIDEVNKLRDYIPEDVYIDLGNTARKEGKIPMFATQQFEHVALDEQKWGQEKKYQFVKSCKRLWFYQFPGPESLLAKLLETSSEDPLIEKVRQVSKSNLLLKEKGIFSWGYIDESKNVKQLIIDSDKVTLWASTTHAGGIAIREACLREGLYDYWTVCELLAERGPWPIPKEAGLAREKIIEIVNRVIHRE